MKQYFLQAKRSDGKWLCLAGREYNTLKAAKEDYYELPAEDRRFYRIVETCDGRRFKTVKL